MQWIFRRRFTGPGPSDVEHAHSEKESLAETTTARSTTGENSTLVFTMSICFAFTSIAYFASLLSFNPSRGGAACGKFHTSSSAKSNNILVCSICCSMGWYGGPSGSTCGTCNSPPRHASPGSIAHRVICFHCMAGGRNEYDHLVIRLLLTHVTPQFLFLLITPSAQEL